MTAPIFVADPDTPEWTAARQTGGLGASEAAAAVGLSPYETAAEIYRRKRGEIEPVEESELMAFGKIVEPSIVRFWEHVEGRPVQAYPMALYRSPKHEFMLATPDAEIDDDEGMEVKSMSPWVARAIDEYGLATAAPQYYVQCTHQLVVMEGWVRVRLVALVERKLKSWTVDRNEDGWERLASLLVEREAEMWDRIQRGEAPPVDLNHHRIAEVVKRLHPKIKAASAVMLSEEAAAALERCEDRNRRMRELKKENDRDKALALLEIGDHAAGVLPGRGRMLRRAVVPSKQISYERGEYIDARLVKCNEDELEIAESGLSAPLLGLLEEDEERDESGNLPGCGDLRETA